MKQVKILLLDLNPSGGLGDTLHGILASSLNADIQLQYETIRIAEPVPLDLKIPDLISDFKPTVIFLVLAPALLSQTSRIFLSLGVREAHEPIMVVIEGCKADELFSLLTMGAADFITPPLTAIDILPRLWRLLEQTQQSKTLTFALKEKVGLGQLVGESPSFLVETAKIPMIAKSDATVLIAGETGTGKELFARAIHYLSPRGGNPFIPASCGAIPLELVENELFGHVQGAFTGASSSQPGLIQEAHRGTLFLDEIDCLPLLAQTKLLRFLQEKEYKQLGSAKVHHADIRVIAATNIELIKAVKDRKFRQDLYYRLNIIPLTLPPLRERQKDIPLLAHHFLKKYAAELERPAEESRDER
jgi:two-component system response regulator GlrR